HQLTGYAPAAIQTTGAWLTPLGEAIIDDEAATAIAHGWHEFGIGDRYFVAEHSLEVQVPFLQHLYGEDLRIVPVIIIDQNRQTSRAVGEAIARGLEGRNAVIVASTDLNHYLPASRAEQLDKLLIDRIVALDPDGLIELARDPRMSMCGYGPVAAMLHAAIALGATSARMLAYSHSGMVAPMHDVVGYVSVSVER
ncbi:MAG: AmmeMemoRadiSam system protein B, partial [Armatimonadetes bacterium]|nr:AmmeMemoRadiSam system protein B [Armatimonadota bacterium]